MEMDRVLYHYILIYINSHFFLLARSDNKGNYNRCEKEINYLFHKANSLRKKTPIRISNTLINTIAIQTLANHAFSLYCEDAYVWLLVELFFVHKH